MQITTISLKNYRVFRDLELEVPPGLVGIYGANGSGKSTLLESILWALYGKARTGKGEIRSSGEKGECVVELGFENDSHHYLVRRSISGANATVKTRVQVGADVVADGITDVGRYLRSTLGMDEGAFRSSVFAEQKQLAAFSDQTPDQRRRLVLQLLGITPIEKARDQARADYRAHQNDHSRLQTLLGPVDDKLARLEAATKQANLAEDAAVLCAAEADRVRSQLEAADRVLRNFADAYRQDQQIRQLGTAARKRRDEAQELLVKLTGEAMQLDEVQEQLDELDARPAVDIEAIELTIERLVRWRDAKQRLHDLGPLNHPESEEPSDGVVRELRARKDNLARAAGAADGATKASEAQVTAARDALNRSESLADAESCPLCGQELREGAEDVRRHRENDLANSVAILERVVRDAACARDELAEVSRALVDAETRFRAATSAYQEATVRADRLRIATEAVAAAESELGPGIGANDETRLREVVRATRETDSRRERLRERVRRRADVNDAIIAARLKLEAAETERTELRTRLDLLRFDAAAHQLAELAAAAARELNESVGVRSVTAQRGAAAAHQRALDAAETLREAQEREQQLRSLADEARYLGRTADLLSGFRQAVVGLVGPQLSMQAADLFNDLTNGEYEGLVIDPDTYEIKVIDAGVAYPSERFSGSEVDLANLALRVAISEQVRFQAGGQVGLLVLDEALASLDTDRKDRMLAALTRLSGRFRQILVVTHAPEVKERLPQAIEVLHLGGRISTARLIDSVPFG